MHTATATVDSETADTKTFFFSVDRPSGDTDFIVNMLDESGKVLGSVVVKYYGGFDHEILP